MKIAIIGAGITGLTAAYELSKKGHNVTVFERSKIPGGLGTYIKIGANYIESFYHHFFESDLEIKNMVREMGIEDKLKFYRAKTGIFSKNKIYSFSSPLDLLKFNPLSFFDRLRCGITLAFLKFLPLPPFFLDNIPAERWIKKYAGINVYKAIWGPLLEGKFSNYAAIIPALWLWGRVRDRSLKLGYLDGSIKVLFDALIKGIKKNGGILRTSSEIKNIITKNGRILIEENGKLLEFDKTIITAVSPIANNLIKNGLSKKMRKHLKSTDQLGTICLILELKQAVQSHYWLNICDRESKVLVMVEHTNMIDKSHYEGKHLVYLANYVHRTSRHFKMSDAEIIEEYTSILKKVNKNYRDSWIINAHVIRSSRAQTIFKISALKSIPPIKIGDNIYMANIDQMYPHDRNIDQGIELGRKVANLISSEP